MEVLLLELHKAFSVAFSPINFICTKFKCEKINDKESECSFILFSFLHTRRAKVAGLGGSGDRGRLLKTIDDIESK